MKKNFIRILLVVVILLVSLKANSQFQVAEYVQNYNSTLPTVYSTDIGGGYQEVLSRTGRNNIDDAKRAIGLMVSYPESGVWYTEIFTGANTLDANWQNDVNWFRLPYTITKVDSSTNSDTATFVLNIIQPQDSITFNSQMEAKVGVITPYSFFADSVTGLIIFTNETGNISYVNATNDIPFVNTTGDTLFPWTPVSTGPVTFGYVRGLPTARIANCDSLNLSQNFQGIPRDTVLPGAVGTIQKQNFNVNSASRLAQLDPNNGNVLFVGCDSNITNISPMPPSYSVTVGFADFTTGIIQVTAEQFTGNDTEVNLQGVLNGIITQRQAVIDTIILGVLYFETYNEEYPTKDLPFLYNLSRYELNTTTNTGTNGYARVALTYGTATGVQTNYIYIDNSGIEPVLTVSTTSFPDDGIRIAECGVLNQTEHEANGFAYFQRFNNSVDGSNSNGWISKAAKRIRLDGSRYESPGVDPTFDIISSAGVDSLNFSTTSGIIWQFNRQTFQSQDGNRYLWLNNPAVPGGLTWVNDLNQIAVDAQNNSLRGNNTRYGLNIFAIQNSGNFNDFLAVTTPNGSYSSDAGAISDASSYSITNVPVEFAKVSVRVARIVVNYSTAGGGTFTNLLGAGEFQDERGFLLGFGGSGGSGGTATTNFSDADFTVFNNADATKIIQFNAGAINTGTTRTYTYPDRSGTLATETLPEITATDSINTPRIKLGNAAIYGSGGSILMQTGNNRNFQMADNYISSYTGMLTTAEVLEGSDLLNIQMAGMLTLQHPDFLGGSTPYYSLGIPSGNPGYLGMFNNDGYGWRNQGGKISIYETGSPNDTTAIFNNGVSIDFRYPLHLPTQTSPAENEAITKAFADANYSGGGSFNPTNTIIVAESGGDTNNINHAIDIANPNDAIIIYPGLYTEDITIDKPLYIIGSGLVEITGEMYIVTDSAEIKNLLLTTTQDSMITSNGCNLTIDNITIKSVQSQGVRLRNGNINIKNCDWQVDQVLCESITGVFHFERLNSEQVIPIIFNNSGIDLVINKGSVINSSFEPLYTQAQMRVQQGTTFNFHNSSVNYGVSIYDSSKVDISNCQLTKYGRVSTSVDAIDTVNISNVYSDLNINDTVTGLHNIEMTNGGGATMLVSNSVFKFNNEKEFKTGGNSVVVYGDSTQKFIATNSIFQNYDDDVPTLAYNAAIACYRPNIKVKDCYIEYINGEGYAFSYGGSQTNDMYVELTGCNLVSPSYNVFINEASRVFQSSDSLKVADNTYISDLGTDWFFANVSVSNDVKRELISRYEVKEFNTIQTNSFFIENDLMYYQEIGDTVSANGGAQDTLIINIDPLAGLQLSTLSGAYRDYYRNIQLRGRFYVDFFLNGNPHVYCSGYLDYRFNAYGVSLSTATWTNINNNIVPYPTIGIDDYLAGSYAKIYVINNHTSTLIPRVDLIEGNLIEGVTLEYK